jgi:23S rRNA (guanosine2251-2'-O)-methyltransferase
MAELILTGFHAVEESVRNAAIKKENVSAMQIFYSNPGPRIKKIIQQANETGILVTQTDMKTLDEMTKNLGVAERDHRGIVIQIKGVNSRPSNIVDFDNWLYELNQSTDKANHITVVILDSVTDPHNVGAIIRSADQFGASLVLLPERNSANKVNDNDVILRTSAGAAAWVPVSVVPNLVRCVEKLKDNGFWVYGADAGGTSVQEGKFAEKTVLIMGSEGSGISRLLKEQCDSIVSIPTCGKIDSLNVSVATGVLLYEIYRQGL